METLMNWIVNATMKSFVFISKITIIIIMFSAIVAGVTKF